MACNICGGQEFKDAPLGRRSSTGFPPVCIKCGSLERHRIFREIFLKIRTPDYREKNCLQFSNDPTTAAGWFKTRDTSIYGVRNSLDVQDIDLPSSTYDIVICNHVIEHVADYKSAIKELCRIKKYDGFLFLSFPNPHGRDVTIDWGYPNPDQHGHFRVFGRDVECEFRYIVPDEYTLKIQERDPVTGVEDVAYIMSRSFRLVEHILKTSGSAEILNR